MKPGVDAASAAIEKLQASERWQCIRQEFESNGDIGRAQQALVQVIDETMAGAFAAFVEPLLPRGAAMLALSAYGRGEPAPYSELRVLFLVESETQWGALREVVSECVRQLWDAGLRVTHAIRTIAECVDVREENLDLRIALLDRRCIAGDEQVHAALESRLPPFIARHSQKLGQYLCQQARLRHTRFENTMRHGEPDVLDAPGGLRDVAMIGCLEKLGMQAAGMTDRLRDAAAFLSAVRCALHFRARTDRNVLSIEAQEDIAAASGRTRGEWMREYFKNAARVVQVAREAMDAPDKAENSLLGNFREWRSRLSNTDFTVSRDRLLLRNPSQLEGDPELALRLIEFVARHDIPPSADSAHRLETVREKLAAYCGEPRPLWSIVKSILTAPHPGAGLRTLDRTGLLAAVFPEWANIEGLATGDSGHRYTMDEETIVAVERASELRNGAGEGKQRFSKLLAEIDNPAALMFALLYHAAGQDADGREYFERSAARARQAAARIGMPAADESDAMFLIEHQLDLSDVMSGRDIGDPATARYLAGRAGTIERLKLLAVMTYARLAAAGPEGLTAWRQEQLWRVYEATRLELTRELETDRIRDIPPTIPGHADFLQGFPVRYLHAHTQPEIEEHLLLYELSRPTGVAVQLDRIEGAYRLTVVARDMPFLFASFAGALSSFGMDILKAEAFSNSKGLILDTFVFADAKRTLDLNPPEAERLQDAIRRVALGKLEVQKLLKNRALPEPKKRSIAPQIVFDSEACATATLVEISAEDRPGLLYRLATVFSSNGCNIDIVLIDTKGRLAMDVFYIACDGRKLTPELQATLQEKLLAVC
jgi:[protein-PII] uridylyltransferase